MSESHRIAIFQYGWPLQVHTANLAIKMTEIGYRVDLFLKDCPNAFIDADELLKNERITVYDIPPDFKQRIKLKINWMLGRHGLTLADKHIISPYVEKESLRLLNGKKYRCFVGIEKKGLIWAGRLARLAQVPYLYYSLELYLEDHPAFFGDKAFAEVRKEEIKYHKASKATIIQDRMRAEVLLKSNGMASADLLFLPVSLAEEENRNKSSWLNEHNSIPPDKKVILYYGKIDKDRLCFELAMQSSHLGNENIMVFHGYGSEEDIEILRENGDLVLSLELVDQHEIKKLISSAAIGLVMYGDTCNNDRLTAFSSEKLALYLQSGIPIIAFDIGNYNNLMDSYRCGELIVEMKQLPDAVGKILHDYESYRAAAFAAYRELYRYEKYFKTIQKYLDSF